MISWRHRSMAAASRSSRWASRDSSASWTGEARSAGQHDQAGGLVLEQVAAARLAGDVRLPEHAEHVVAQLERLPDQLAVRTQHLQHRLARAGQRGPELERAAHRVVAGLAPGHVQDLVQGGIAAGVVDQVGELPDGQLTAQRVVAGPAAGQRGRGQAAVPEQLLGPDQAQVREQDGGRLPEVLGRPVQALGPVPAGQPHVGGGLAAAERGPVHHVVLEQGEGVHQFGAGRGAGGGVAFGRSPVGGGTEPAQVGEGRPDELAPGHEPGQQVGQEGGPGHAAHVFGAPFAHEIAEHGGGLLLPLLEPSIQVRSVKRPRRSQIGRIDGVAIEKLTHLHACGLRSGQRTDGRPLPTPAMTKRCTNDAQTMQVIIARTSARPVPGWIATGRIAVVQQDGGMRRTEVTAGSTGRSILRD